MASLADVSARIFILLLEYRNYFPQFPQDYILWPAFRKFFQVLAI